MALANLLVGAWVWLSPRTEYMLSPLQVAVVFPPVAASLGFFLRRRTQPRGQTQRRDQLISRLAYLPLCLGGIAYMPAALLIILTLPFFWPTGIAGEHRVYSRPAPIGRWVADVWAVSPVLSVNDAVVSVRVGWRLFPVIERSVYMTSSDTETDIDVRWKDAHTLLILRWWQDGSGGYDVVRQMEVGR